jgi:hypothetical protein
MDSDRGSARLVRGGRRRRWAGTLAGVLLTVVCASVCATLASPAPARADVGALVPAASSFVARIDSVPAGLRAQVGEGDRLLALQVPPRLTVLVLGLEGEPYLRFSARGVALNEHAPTAYLNSYSPRTVPAGVSAHAPATWKLLSGAHTYLWPEDRLHELDLAARIPGTGGYVGRWTIPLRIDGRASAIGGSLLYSPAPSRAWLWPLVVLLACLPALLRLRRPAWNERATVALACLALLAFVLCKLAFDLYGRPEVSVERELGFAASLTLAVVGLVLLVRLRWRAPVAVVIGMMSIAEGLDMRETLLRGFVLAALPDPVVRGTAILALAAGLGAVLVPLLTGALRGPPEGDRTESRRGGARLPEAPMPLRRALAQLSRRP